MLVQSFCWQYCLPSYLCFTICGYQCKTNLKQVHKKVKKKKQSLHHVTKLTPSSLLGSLQPLACKKMWSHSLWADRMEREWRTRMQTENKR